jgi:hypothetical protein
MSNIHVHVHRLALIAARKSLAKPHYGSKLMETRFLGGMQLTLVRLPLHHVSLSLSYGTHVHTQTYTFLVNSLLNLVVEYIHMHIHHMVMCNSAWVFIGHPKHTHIHTYIHTYTCSYGDV